MITFVFMDRENNEVHVCRAKLGRNETEAHKAEDLAGRLGLTFANNVDWMSSENVAVITHFGVRRAATEDDE